MRCRAKPGISVECNGQDCPCLLAAKHTRTTAKATCAAGHRGQPSNRQSNRAAHRPPTVMTSAPTAGGSSTAGSLIFFTSLAMRCFWLSLARVDLRLLPPGDEGPVVAAGAHVTKCGGEG